MCVNGYIFKNYTHFTHFCALQQKWDEYIVISRQKRGITKAIRKRQKRRNAIEPIIGHCKNDRKTGAKNWLKGIIGDKINAIAIAIGFNLRKILREILCCLFQIGKIIEQFRIFNQQNLKTSLF
jgi:hypothetical protein